MFTYRLVHLPEKMIKGNYSTVLSNVMIIFFARGFKRNEEYSNREMNKGMG